MFYDATAFKQPIGNWDVSNVTSSEDFSQGAPLTQGNTITSRTVILNHL